jgi:small subunit ribosomal protein S9
VTEEQAVTQTETKQPETAHNEFFGLGRRKTSIARIRLRRGNGKIVVNKKDINEYFTDPRQLAAVRAPLKELKATSRYDVSITASGGGLQGQSEAVVLGIARALADAEPDNESKLRDAGMLTRDPRMKERKKYGHLSARASFQFSKR